ncbi:MAG: HD-GYP domain-containing protein, partial [Thermodesulfobacteriota bacterium]
HTYRHVLMVFVLTATLAKELQSGHFRRIQESMTGPTHDFGKICIPLSILNKSTALTRKELQIIRHHTVAGYVLLAHYLGDRNHIAARVALNHHECLDGSGYPRGIRELDPIVEIKAVADVYDALISPRPYRPVSFDNRSALEVLTQMAEKGTVSRNVVKALIAHNRKDKPHYQEVIISSEKRGIPPANNMYGIITDEEGN